MKLREQKGFTLIEVIVVAGIIAILAGILVPLIFKEIDESKISRATADVRSISAAMIVLRKDVGQWPVSTTCHNTGTLLHGAGTIPALAAGWDDSVKVNFEDVLNADTSGCWPNWKGPYIAYVAKDPWGHAYMVNADALRDATATNAPIWIVSAGPDGVLNTDATYSEVGGDDIGMRLR